MKLIVDWFTDKCMAIYRADTIQLIKRFTDPKKKAVYVERTTNQAAELFGINSNVVGYVVSDDDNHYSTLYTLVLFGTTGEKGVRKHEDYMGKYFISQYGTIKDIDFTPIFEQLLGDEREV